MKAPHTDLDLDCRPQDAYRLLPPKASSNAAPRDNELCMTPRNQPGGCFSRAVRHSQPDSQPAALGCPFHSFGRHPPHMHAVRAGSQPIHARREESSAPATSSYTRGTEATGPGMGSSEQPPEARTHACLLVRALKATHSRPGPGPLGVKAQHHGSISRQPR